jgi:hypothetical protein
VQCSADGSLGQYVLVLGFRPLLESIEAWFYILLAARQFLLQTKSVFPLFPFQGIPVRYLSQGIFCRLRMMVLGFKKLSTYMRHTTHQSDSMGGFGYGLIHSIAITLNSTLEGAKSFHKTTLAPTFAIVEQYQIVYRMAINPHVTLM